MKRAAASLAWFLYATFAASIISTIVWTLLDYLTHQSGAAL